MENEWQAVYVTEHTVFIDAETYSEALAIATKVDPRIEGEVTSGPEIMTLMATGR